jgi:dGTPase
MADYGGFEHNRQAVRIVDFLEHPYPDFAGLNLMYETRLGFGKHHSPYDHSDAGDFTEPVPSLEGQIADVADRIAYNCHDLEDGQQSRLIQEEDLQGINLFVKAQERIEARKLTDRVVRRTQTSKTMIDILVSDVIETSRTQIEAADIKSLDDVYAVGKPLITLSEEAQKKLEVLEYYLLNNMYFHPEIKAVAQQVAEWMPAVFDKLMTSPGRMPRYFQNMIPEQGSHRVVCDYVAGMTDRYCLTMLEK